MNLLQEKKMVWKVFLYNYIFDNFDIFLKLFLDFQRFFAGWVTRFVVRICVTTVVTTMCRNIFVNKWDESARKLIKIN